MKDYTQKEILKNSANLCGYSAISAVKKEELNAKNSKKTQRAHEKDLNYSVISAVKEDLTTENHKVGTENTKNMIMKKQTN